MSDDADYLMALEIQKRWNAESSADVNASGSSGSEAEIVSFDMPPPSKRPLRVNNYNSKYTSNMDDDYLNRTQNLVHPMWETLDPTPDIFALFTAFDDKFFQSRLKCVTLEWSKRMYSCAGICYSRRNRLGMDVTIRLSEPLLKLRPRKDMIETLLHEMIHAYCFVLNIREGNGGHGPNFKKIMYAINKVAGTNITVYHTFYDEVDIYKQHWWRCNGSCQNRAPFFGYVKRTSNRAPSANDQWWAAHQESCGGTFMKIKEPEKPKKQKSTKEVKANNATDLRKFFPATGSTSSNANNAGKVNGFSGSGFKGPVKTNGGGTLLINPKTKRNTITMNTNTSEKQPSIASAFPPTSYPGLSSDPFSTNVRATSTGTGTPTRYVAVAGNLRNVVGFSDLASGGGTGRNTSAGKSGAVFAGSGCQLNSHNSVKCSSSGAGGEVDRNHLRDMWSKRFGGSNTSGRDEMSKNDNNSINYGKQVRALESDTEVPTGDTKRRRLSCEADTDDVIAISSVDKPAAQKNAWLVLDDDVMLREQPNETIAISSDEDEDDEAEREKVAAVRTTSTLSKTLTADQRQTIIKQEILEDTADLLDEDIILIDDEYNDEADNNDALNLSAAVELADTSVIDEFFGEDTLLKEFKRENDVVPTFSRNIPNPNDDIITCPVCQGKLKRSLFAEHMDGCTGIAVRIVLPKHALKKLSGTSHVLKPTNRARTSRKNKKDILRQAGYTEQDLLNITSESSTEDDEHSLTSNNVASQPTSPIANSTTIELSPDDSGSRRRNNRSTTVSCPNCQRQIESLKINEHLDVCLSS